MKSSSTSSATTRATSRCIPNSRPIFAIEEFERAFARPSTKGVKGVIPAADPSVFEHDAKIAELAQISRLPTMFQRRENVEVGGLLSYGPNLNELFGRAAFYVHRILKGARPAELPVEQPTTFELVINLKTARCLVLRVVPAARRRGNRLTALAAPH
jgi:putative tryptophan/tyrosine transport system substrate-binding protein